MQRLDLLASRGGGRAETDRHAPPDLSAGDAALTLTFNLALQSFGVDPANVRLLRHETRDANRTAYALWRDDPAIFEGWQAIQLRSRRAWFVGKHWAAFVVAPGGRTVFVGLYAVDAPRVPLPGERDPLRGNILDPEWVDVYPTRLVDGGSDYAGRLAVDWGRGTRTWAQRADRQDKPIIELRVDRLDPPFPGFATFTAQLSDLTSLPPAWNDALSAVHGVYLLTCPRTHEQYVGSATGSGGFLARWHAYLGDGHGGNVGLRIREPSDYRVSILQVAGSADDRDDVLMMETVWKTKLQSREMGLNKN